MSKKEREREGGQRERKGKKREHGGRGRAGRREEQDGSAPNPVEGGVDDGTFFSASISATRSIAARGARNHKRERRLSGNEDYCKLRDTV